MSALGFAAFVIGLGVLGAGCGSSGEGSDPIDQQSGPAATAPEDDSESSPTGTADPDEVAENEIADETVSGPLPDEMAWTAFDNDLPIEDVFGDPRGRIVATSRGFYTTVDFTLYESSDGITWEPVTEANALDSDEVPGLLGPTPGTVWGPLWVDGDTLHVLETRLDPLRMLWWRSDDARNWSLTEFARPPRQIPEHATERVGFPGSSLVGDRLWVGIRSTVEVDWWAFDNGDFDPENRRETEEYEVDRPFISPGLDGLTVWYLYNQVEPAFFGWQELDPAARSHYDWLITYSTLDETDLLRLLEICTECHDPDLHPTVVGYEYLVVDLDGALSEPAWPFRRALSSVEQFAHGDGFVAVASQPRWLVRSPDLISWEDEIELGTRAFVGQLGSTLVAADSIERREVPREEGRLTWTGLVRWRDPRLYTADGLDGDLTRGDEPPIDALDDPEGRFPVIVGTGEAGAALPVVAGDVLVTVAQRPESPRILVLRTLNGQDWRVDDLDRHDIAADEGRRFVRDAHIVVAPDGSLLIYDQEHVDIGRPVGTQD